MTIISLRDIIIKITWGDDSMFAIMFLIFFSSLFVGICSLLYIVILSMQKKNSEKPSKIFKTCAILFVVSFILLIVSIKKENNTEETNIDQEAQNNIADAEVQNTEKKEEIEELSFTDELAKDTGSEIANAAYDILTNQIGFSELKYNGKMGETSNYEIIADGTNMVITAMDDYYRIFVPNTDYVFYEDGTVLLSAQEFNDKKIDVHDRDVYYIMATEIVTNNLKNPSSADFPSSVTHPEEIAMEKNGNIITVQSYVDAKNSFNAKVREYWTVQFIVYDIQNYSYEPTYIKIGNDESGSLLDM